jgi:hypothetical protein
MMENKNMTSENDERAFIPVDFMYRKHDYFVAKCLADNHIHEICIHVSKGNPKGYTKGLVKVTKEQYKEWFQVDYDSEERRAHLREVFAENIPYLFAHREEILSRADYYFAQTPLCVMFVGRVYLGALLRAYELENSPFVWKCDDEACGGKGFIYSFQGSPLSGSMIGSSVCCKCGKISIVRSSNFRKLMVSLHDIIADDVREMHIPTKPGAQPPIRLEKRPGGLVIDYTPQEEEMSTNRLTVFDVINLLQNLTPPLSKGEGGKTAL